MIGGDLPLEIPRNHLVCWVSDFSSNYLTLPPYIGMESNILLSIHLRFIQAPIDPFKVAAEDRSATNRK